jgi:5'-AMP-activated protein kinase catalytic alpha subunit
MKRITIADVRQHQWFQHKLPAYLALPPELIEMQERYVDEEILNQVCALPLRGVGEANVREAVLNRSSCEKSVNMHEMRVAYELLLDAKRHKQRIADVVLALQDSSRTPPTGASPRVLGLSASPSPSPSSRIELSGAGGAGAPRGADASKDASARRRRWFLGIQSKKDPAHVMTEVYKALLALGCKWHPITNYRVLCIWNAMGSLDGGGVSLCNLLRA